MDGNHKGGSSKFSNSNGVTRSLDSLYNYIKVFIVLSYFSLYLVMSSKFNFQVVLNAEEAKAIKGWKLNEGTLVEIHCDEDGLKGAWFAATIIKMVEKDKFLIQYKKLRTDDDKQFLTEEVDKKNIRPYPPEAVKVDNFKLNEEVDALHNDGWWEGVICKILRGKRYQVYFKGTDDRMSFKHSELRPRQEWIDETWVMAN